MSSESDPIIARATPAGKGGVGIVRLSGACSAIESILAELFPAQKFTPRHAYFLALKDAAGGLIDEGVVLLFAAPHSYTGETVLEIQGHGSPAVMELIIKRCLQVGRNQHLRLAEPGEFTQRAFLNGRMDLAQAEAVADLIDAGSTAAARAAARSLQGAFSQQVEELNQKLINLRIFVEATLDFPEEDIEFIHQGKVREQLTAIEEEFHSLEKRAMRGKVLRDGLSVVLVGAPNVGKSSLMNRLAGDEVAIVTSIAGTTRDRIEKQVELDGLLVNLIDTAGLRHSDDPVEKIGIDRTLQAVANADLVLRLTSPEQEDSSGDAQALAMVRSCLREGVQTFTVVNKIDLLGADEKLPTGAIGISAKTGQGLDELIDRLKSVAGMTEDEQGDFLARTRHLECLARAYTHLEAAQQALAATTLDIVAEELRLAGNELGEIVGTLLPDDLLGQIFSKFCIGK